MLVEALVVQAAISPTIHKRSQPLESLRSRHLRRRRESSISVSLATNIVDLSRFGRDEFGDTSYCTRMIAKHHLPSLARPRLTAERPSEDGGHESAFGRGRKLGLSTQLATVMIMSPCSIAVKATARQGGVLSAEARGDIAKGALGNN